MAEGEKGMDRKVNRRNKISVECMSGVGLLMCMSGLLNIHS